MEGRDLTKGNLLKNMLLLIIPLFLTNLLNSIYSIVDGIWIGNLIGENGVAVITNCYPLTYIVTSISTGLAVATSVMVSQYYGAKDNDKLKSVIGVTYLTTIIVGCIVSLFMIITSSLWLKLLNTPLEIFSITRQYLILYLIGSMFNFILMVIMEALRGIGNTRVPLIFVGISTTINLILDPILIRLGLGITGTAIATLIAMVIGTFIAIIYVNNRSKILRIDFKYFKFDKKILTQFLKTGIPIMFENCFLAGMHLLEVNVSNSTGVISNAGYGVAGKVEQMISIMSSSIKTMATVTVGQFIGIKKVKESINVMEQGLKISVIPTVLIFIVGFVLPRHICRIFVSSEEVISMAIIYLSAVRIAYIILPTKELLHGFIIGTGHTKFVLFSVGVSSIVEVVTILILKNTSVNNLTALGTGVLLWVITALILDIIYFFSNRWQKNSITLN